MKRKLAVHQRLGAFGERLACRLLRAKGFELLARNWRVAAGELDIVARDGGTIVFVEVKTRRPKSQFRPLDNLGWVQCRRNRCAAGVYMKLIGNPELPVRFDLIEVVAWRFRVLSIFHHVDYLPDVLE